jgi:5-deoxy-glucuronate isomerase
MQKFFNRVEVKEGYTPVVRQNNIFKHIGEFGILRLTGGRSFKEICLEHETTLVVLSGTCSVSAGDKTWEDIGSRRTVFDGLPTALYVPPGIQYSVISEDVEIGVCKVRCRANSGTPVLITPDKVKVMQVGRDNWSREVRIMIGPDSPAQKMIIGETLNPPGNWSGTPPHKHENDNLPEESLHEELYYFRTDKPQGWGIERLYSSERNINEFIYLQNNTVTFMPWGYHQIVASPGYTLYYLFFLAGNGTKLAGFEDRQHNWIKNMVMSEGS